jgi:hypothetical protein
MVALLLLLALVALAAGAVVAFIQKAHALGLVALGLFLLALIQELPNVPGAH